MSRQLVDYGDRKGTSQTTARGLGEFLGAEIIKDKELNCKFILSQLPHGAPVSERAVPTAIWKAEPAVTKRYLRRWLKDPGMERPGSNFRRKTCPHGSRRRRSRGASSGRSIAKALPGLRAGPVECTGGERFRRVQEAEDGARFRGRVRPERRRGLLTRHEWLVVKLRELASSEGASSNGASLPWVMIGDESLRRIRIEMSRTVHIDSRAELRRGVVGPPPAKRAEKHLPHKKEQRGALRIFVQIQTRNRTPGSRTDLEIG